LMFYYATEQAAEKLRSTTNPGRARRSVVP
jgi:hypothetical protein